MRISFFSIITTILFFGFNSSVFSQNSNLKFEKLPSHIGWADKAVNDILQDHEGYIWIATWNGIKKYDGYSIKSYSQDLNNPNGLKGNKIKCLFEDSKNRLWIGTNYSGMYLYNRALDEFIQYKEEVNGLNSNYVFAIEEDKDGFLWIGTENGLNRFDPETETFLHFENAKNKNPKTVFSFACSDEGSFWVGTDEGLGLLVKRDEGPTDYFVKYSLNPDNASDHDFYRHNYIHKIIPSQVEPNTLWVATSIGIKKVKYFPEDKSKIEFETILHEKELGKGISHGFISDIYEDQEKKQLWIATYNGLNLFDIATKQFQYIFHDKFLNHSINSNVVRTLYKDKSNLFWIGTDKGINYIDFSNDLFKSIQFSEIQKDIELITTMKISNTRDGVWFGTNGTGLGYLAFDQNSFTSKNIKHFPIIAPVKEDFSGSISDLIISNDGDIWVASKGAGLLKIPREKIPKDTGEITNLVQYTSKGKLAADHVMTLIQSRDGLIWMGYWSNGIGCLNPQTEEVIHFNFARDTTVNFRKYPIVHLKETIENGENILWVGLRGGGLYKLRFDSSSQELELIHHYQFTNGIDNSISNNFINGIYQPTDDAFKNELWICTEGGLNILDKEGDIFTCIDKSNGLQSQVIQSVVEDSIGNIWLSTIDGISRVNRKTDRFEVSNFDSYDGIGSDLFYDKAGITLDNGQIILGGLDGVTYFLPSEIEKNQTPPKAAIVDFRLFNQSVGIGKLENERIILSKNITQTKRINLTHRDNVISFEFLGLFSNEPQKLKYAYKLEGFHEDWIYTNASERIAHFTNLPYKTFQLKVKVANSDEVWGETAVLTLSIAPPFWMTNWAFFLYFVVACLLLYGFLRIVKMRSDFKHSLQLARVEREKMEEVNHMKLQFFTNISHELRTPLTLIISPLEQFITQKDIGKKHYSMMVLMHQNANRLLTMINQLLDIRKSEAGMLKLKVAENNFVGFTGEIITSFKDLAQQDNIELNFYPSEHFIPLWFDHDQMEKVWFNLLSNSIKFTPENGRIDVHLFEDPDSPESVTVEIMDTGIGIPEDKRTQIFNRFYQLEEDSADTRGKGTGIGLALTKSILEAHHGKIWIRENQYGGSTFVFTLLKGASHFSRDEKLIHFKNSENIENYIPLKGYLENTYDEKDLKESSPSEKEKPLILLVEDNSDIRYYLHENLILNYRVIQAVDGEEGYQKSLKEIPDLIIADIAMPKMNGIDMCQKIKSQRTTSHIPIILLTARTSLIYKINGMENGADDYVTKPFNMELLKSRIRNLIDSRIKLREKFATNDDLTPSGVVMNTLDEELLSKIKSIVESNIDNSKFSVEQLSAALFMSRMQLYRKLKALTGKTPNQIIRSIRLKRAAQLLETKRYNVSDVTYMVGYNDLQYFRDQFKKEYGIKPSEYAK